MEANRFALLNFLPWLTHMAFSVAQYELNRCDQFFFIIVQLNVFLKGQFLSALLAGSGFLILILSKENGQRRCNFFCMFSFFWLALVNPFHYCAVNMTLHLCFLISGGWVYHRVGQKARSSEMVCCCKVLARSLKQAMQRKVNGKKLLLSTSNHCQALVFSVCMDTYAYFA